MGILSPILDPPCPPGVLRLGSSHRSGIFPAAGRHPPDLFMQQPSRVVVHAQVTAEIQRGDASLSLPD